VNKETSTNNTNNNVEDDLIILSKLRWHCRRGVKELDVVLTNYLNRYYLKSDKQKQEAFVELLKIEDPILMSLVMGHTKTEDPIKNQLLDKIKNPYS